MHAGGGQNIYNWCWQHCQQEEGGVGFAAFRGNRKSKSMEVRYKLSIKPIGHPHRQTKWDGLPCNQWLRNMGNHFPNEQLFRGPDILALMSTCTQQWLPLTSNSNLTPSASKRSGLCQTLFEALISLKLAFFFNFTMQAELITNNGLHC